MKNFLTAAILFLLFSALYLSEAKAQTFSGSIGAVRRGGTVKGSIVMNIPSGLHVNSNRPNSEYAIPTVIKLNAPGAKVGSVAYPRGKNRKFGFSEDILNVYEGRTVFNFNLNIPANFKGSVVKIRAVIRYQPCTDEVCYPPKGKEITLTANVK